MRGGEDVSGDRRCAGRRTIPRHAPAQNACRALAILREKEEVTAEEVKTAKRIALSSMPVHRAEVLSAYRTESKMSAKQVSDLLDKNYKTVKRHLDQLLHLKVLRSEKDSDGKTTRYFPDPRFEKLILSSVGDLSLFP